MQGEAYTRYTSTWFHSLTNDDMHPEPLELISVINCNLAIAFFRAEGTSNPRKPGEKTLLKIFLWYIENLLNNLAPVRNVHFPHFFGVTVHSPSGVPSGIAVICMFFCLILIATLCILCDFLFSLNSSSLSSRFVEVVSS